MTFQELFLHALKIGAVRNVDIARKFNISSQAVSQWKVDKRPSRDHEQEVIDYLSRCIAEKEGVEVKAPDLPADLADDKASDAPLDYVAVRTLDVRAGAGGGGIVDDHAFGPPRFFEAGFVQRELRATAADLCVVEIEGQSMEPLLRNGDTVLVDMRKKNVSMEGIFVLFDGDGVVCKWVELVHGAETPTFKVISENQRFKPYEVDAQRCQILGRVVWFSRRL